MLLFQLLLLLLLPLALLLLRQLAVPHQWAQMPH